MIFRIAWRNIWRNRLRSLVVIFSVILGIWAGIFMLSLSFGINEARTKTQISNFISHAQIHHPEFKKDYKLIYQINDIDETEKVLKENENVKAYSKRILVGEAILISSKGDRGVKIIGINPEREAALTAIHTKVISGSYFGEIKGKAALISKRLAEKIGAEVKSKLIIRYQDSNGDITQTKFKVVGIYETVNSNYDEVNVYVKNADLSKALNLNDAYHEIGILTDNKENAKALAAEIQPILPKGNLMEYWGKIAPELGFADEMMAQTLIIFMGIIMLALLFGIVNTMLMAILERKRELGMLMSVGMNKRRLFSMIVFETILLSLIGAPLGILLAHLSVSYFGQVGIDLSIVSEGMQSFGMGAILHPAIDTSFYLDITIMVIITALLAALVPARKALKLKPAEAVKAI